jgi:hypothetical protein
MTRLEDVDDRAQLFYLAHQLKLSWQQPAPFPNPQPLPQDGRDIARQ